MDLLQYFSSVSLKKTDDKIGIHFEQKITPDLLWCVALSALNLVGESADIIFSDNDIRQSSYFNSIMGDYFTKPEQGENTENEYNKVSSYQLGILVYADVLIQVEDRPKKYKINNIEILRFIATNDRNALLFLEAYVDKWISDNNLLLFFQQYSANPNQQNYDFLKDKYWEWAKINTNVRTNHPTHSRRVFNKIFNLYAHKHGLPGQKSARVKDGVCPFQYLIYNKTNFRDVEMPAGISRREFRESLEIDPNNPSITAALIARSKSDVKNRHAQSEVSEDDSYEENIGIHIHHIFPESEYPNFSFFRENLIALTPGQHLSYAHERANTQRVNRNFQIVCLLSKLNSIKSSLDARDKFYNLANFINMMRTVFANGLLENSTCDQIKDYLFSKRQDE